MGIARHEQINFSFGPLHGHPDQLTEMRLQLGNFCTQPEANIGGNLVITAAPGVQFPGNSANQLGQAAFIGGVNIFIIGLDHKFTPAPFLSHQL